jgi:hypothetical protein
LLTSSQISLPRERREQHPARAASKKERDPMDRRNFLKSMLGVAGAAAAASAFATRAEALPLFDELQAMDATGVNSLKTAEFEADLPAPGAVDSQYYYGPRRGYRRRWVRPMYRPMYRRRFRRCRTVVNRWGRLVRRCWVG